jgi:radical SAM superfamily enzyme YgiQ (UPF0313 family)
MRTLDVLFVEPNSSVANYQDLAHHYAAIETPTWSLLLANSCRAKGYGVDILDANALRLLPQDAASQIVARKPRMACLVVYGQNPNSGTCNMDGTIEIANAIKEISDIPVIVVGSHASALPRDVLRHKSVDIVLTNEGVYALHNLLASGLTVQELRDIKGIGYKEDGNQVINAAERIVPQERMTIDLPGYAWDLLPYKNKPFDLYRSHYWHTKYREDGRNSFAAMYTSFGCKFKCHFCMINILNRTDMREDAVSSDFNVMRYWPSDFMIREFETLYEKYGVTNIRLSDEMFFLNKDHYQPLIKELEKRNYPLNMCAYSRVDTCKKDWLESFKKVGINWLALGIEAANQQVRQEITKGSFKDVNIRDIVKVIKDADINIVGNFIYGFPNENMENLQQTLDLAIELNTEHPNMYCATALPGSPLYRQAVQEGWELPSKYSQYGFYSYDYLPLPTKHLTPREVLKFRDEAWLKYNTGERYLGMIESRFGLESRQNIEKQTKITLKRKVLES